MSDCNHHDVLNDHTNDANNAWECRLVHSQGNMPYEDEAS